MRDLETIFPISKDQIKADLLLKDMLTHQAGSDSMDPILERDCEKKRKV